MFLLLMAALFAITIHVLQSFREPLEPAILGKVLLGAVGCIAASALIAVAVGFPVADLFGPTPRRSLQRYSSYILFVGVCASIFWFLETTNRRK